MKKTLNTLMETFGFMVLLALLTIATIKGFWAGALITAIGFLIGFVYHKRKHHDSKV